MNSNTSKGLTGSKTTRTKPTTGMVRKRKDGRWEGRVTVGYDPMSGKQIQKSVYGHTKSEARNKLSKIINEVDEGTYRDVERIKVNQWLDIWLDETSSPVRAEVLHDGMRILTLKIENFQIL